ncbi:MAG TPA: PEP-CTERM sorting domain-containing protein [Usitatibacter sp.]|nr:PEP-CTERM sorting domain-containing protein [Usitatibacter sp.]
MRSHYRFFAIVATAFAAASAFGQQQRAIGPNPISRGESGLFGPAFRTELGGPLDGGNALARPSMVHNATPTPVTPVPEPSEWLMLAAGLGVGLVVLRRGARRG